MQPVDPRDLSKNLADDDEYPTMLHLHQRCVSIIDNLWGAQGTDRKEQAIGTATTGSSEATMSGGLAMKHRWVEVHSYALVVSIPSSQRFASDGIRLIIWMMSFMASTLPY